VSTPERILVDTTVWIDALRGQTPTVVERLRDLLREDRVATCGPIRCEIRRGLRVHERGRLLPLMEAVASLPFGDEDWDEAGILDAGLRARGVTMPPFDVLIARVALREGLSLFTLDRHFTEVQALRLHAL
jgi:predicted nucleic acid-binding protein